MHISIEPWDEQRAMREVCICVHIFAQKANGNLMFYLETDIESIALTTIPRPCGCVDEALSAAKTTAAQNNVPLVLVDDNRID